jgi:CRISPR/Cas system-associated protein Csx1
MKAPLKSLHLPQNPKYFHTVDFAFPGKVVHSLSNSAAIMTLLNMKGLITVNIIQLMTFHEVNTKIEQPMEHDIHRGIRGEFHEVVGNHHRIKFCH